MKARAHKSKKGQYGADEQRLSGGLRLPKWLVVDIAIALVAGASYAACVFLLPGRIPPELVGQWRVVGGSERFCCGGSRMRPVGQASRSRAWKRVSVSKRLSVFTSAWDFGYGVRSAPMRQCLPATSRPASYSKRCSGSSND